MVKTKTGYINVIKLSPNKALFSDVEEVEKKCSILNEQIKNNRKEY